MKPAIRVQNLSKSYRIGSGPRGEYRTLREAIASTAAAPWRRFRDLSRRGVTVVDGDRTNAADHIWALKDVSFEVQPGEVVGVIGRNGAGKSTLLKVLSRITEPTLGRAEFRGRIASLLEVGTGFHPELTGRENIYLNGSVLGMSRREVARKFDEIVAFSEIEKFLDTPVKRYSSGMYVRLAFAVAAHLEPEILIVDEVLAVGDSEFQSKCLGKMQDVCREGRSILFVSHNIGTLEVLCDRGILMDRGMLVQSGSIGEVVTAYLRDIEKRADTDVASRQDRLGAGAIRLAGITVTGADSSESQATGRPARFIFHLSRPSGRTICRFTIYNSRGHAVAHFDSGNQGVDDELQDSGCSRIVCEIPQLALLPGRYRINTALFLDGDLQDHLEGAVTFDVDQGHVRGRSVKLQGGHYGDVHLSHRWLSANDDNTH